MPELLHTALYQLHLELGARMAPFAGYDMPIQYPAGILKEHLHTRAKASLFDVSHMGQLRLWGPEVASALETLTPADLIGMPTGQQRYTLLTNELGGILDDLMVTHAGDHLFVVVNAACKEQDTIRLRGHIGERCRIEALPEQALLALQGPAAETVLARLVPAADFADWDFMTARTLLLCGVECLVTRSGYTGEDGFEISIPNSHAETLARTLLAQPEVAPAGLGARDSLRLEAGLCLYGHDIDTATSPVEAGLAWAVAKPRRIGGAREGDFPGEDRILAELVRGTNRLRTGLVGLERTPVRAGAAITNLAGEVIGKVTSGGFAPSRNGNVAMAYLPVEYTADSAEVLALVRGKPMRMQVTKMPFVPTRYHRL
jgi:aminomethyltransferase